MFQSNRLPTVLPVALLARFTQERVNGGMLDNAGEPYIIHGCEQDAALPYITHRDMIIQHDANYRRNL